MKKKFLKWVLISLVLLLTVTVCRNENQSGKVSAEETIEAMEKEGALEIMLLPVAKNFSMEGIHPSTALHYVKDVTVYLKYATGSFVTYAWTSAEIATKRKFIPATGIPDLLFVAVNGETLANGQFANTAELNAAYNPITIESQNIPVTLNASDVNGNLAGTYGTSQTVMIFGDTTTTTPHPVLNNMRQAAVELSSAVARFELGKLQAADPTQLTSVTIDAIYANNYHPTLSKDTTVSIDEFAWETNKPADGHWAKTLGNDDLVTSNAGTMCYAFQIFPDLVPHFIYKISGTLAPGVKLDDGTTGNFSGKYVTITGFSELSNSPPVRHNIYKVGLTAGGIAIGVNNITDLPYVDGKALEVMVTIAPWNEQTITPEIF